MMNDVQQRPLQRRRVIVGFTLPEPFCETAITRSAIRHTSIIPLNNLTQEGAEPSMLRAINVQVLIIIVHNPHIQNRSSVQAYSRQGGRFGQIIPAQYLTQDYFYVVYFQKHKAIFLFT